MTAVLQATTGRLYPTAAQLQSMARIGGQCRALWNHWVATSAERYATKGKFAFYAEMSAALPAMRKEERYAGLPHRCAQMVTQKLDRALRDCAKAKAGRKGFPKFKRRDDRTDAFQFVGRELKVEPGRIKFPPSAGSAVVACACPMVPAGAGHRASGARRLGRGSPDRSSGPAYAVPTLPMVGIDVGLGSLIALSTGEKIAAPRFARRVAGRLRKLERQKADVARAAWPPRTVARLGREHGRLAARRRDFTHKLSRALVDCHEGLAVEKLRLKGLMRTRLGKSFADAGIAELLCQIAYKADWAGRESREMSTFHRSTGVCPCCGEVGPKLPLSVRAWRCAGCASEHDRDTAAAQVILSGAVPRGTREPGGASRRKRAPEPMRVSSISVEPPHGLPAPNAASTVSRHKPRE